MRKLKAATLHQSIHAPELGSLGPKLTANQDPILKQVTLQLTDDGQTLLVGTPGKTTVISVPIHNVSHYVE